MTSAVGGQRASGFTICGFLSDLWAMMLGFILGYLTDIPLKVLTRPFGSKFSEMMCRANYLYWGIMGLGVGAFGKELRSAYLDRVNPFYWLGICETPKG